MRPIPLACVLGLLFLLLVRQSVAESFFVTLSYPELPMTDAVNLPPKPYGEDWRRIATFGGADDSTCIGNPKTPLCAVDTLLSCRWRSDDALCSIAFDEQVQEAHPDRDRSPQFVDYRVMSFGPYDCRKVFKEADVRCWPAKPRDRLMVIQWRSCNASLPSQRWHCDLSDPEIRMFIYLRPARGRWVVRDLDSPRY